MTAGFFEANRTRSVTIPTRPSDIFALRQQSNTKNFNPQISVFAQAFTSISIASDAIFRQNGAAGSCRGPESGRLH
jgi:hypothetical protein